MYLPSQFREDDGAFVESFVDAHPLATVVVPLNGKTLIDHIPFMRRHSLTRGGTLIAHAAKANPLSKVLITGVPAALVFTGASAYVSPSWYPSKALHHEVVPTWNYVAVHVHGMLRCTTDDLEKRGFVDALTRKMEASNPTPWSIEDTPATYLEKMLDGIVGLIFDIESITSKTKASQNRSSDDQQGVMEGLLAVSADDAAATVERFVGGKARV